MKSMKVLSVGLLALALPVMAATMSESALKMVPGGKVVQEKDKEIKVQTKENTIVEIEFKRNGDFEEASGKMVDKDNFEPGQNLLSLKDALAAVKKAGKNPNGEWSLDDSMIKGWHYEFEGIENGKSMEYVVDAKTGTLKETKQDD